MTSNEIVLEIREADRDVVLVTASGAWGTVMLMGSVRVEDRTIFLTVSISEAVTQGAWGAQG